MSESESNSVFERMREIAAAGGVVAPTTTGATVFDDSWRGEPATVTPPTMGTPEPSNPAPGPYEATKAVEVPVNRRARRTKAQMIADGDKPAPVVTLSLGLPDPPKPPPVEPAVVSVSEPTAPWTGIDTLYINCMPLGCEFTMFFELLRDANSLLGCDYRLGEAHKFGVGAGKLVEAVGIAVQNAKASNVVIDTGTPEAGICLEMIKGVSKRLVLGTR
jgi:hypothetical protein